MNSVLADLLSGMLEPKRLLSTLMSSTVSLYSSVGESSGVFLVKTPEMLIWFLQEPCYRLTLSGLAVMNAFQLEALFGAEGFADS